VRLQGVLATGWPFWWPWALCGTSLWKSTISWWGSACRRPLVELNKAWLPDCAYSLTGSPQILRRWALGSHICHTGSQNWNWMLRFGEAKSLVPWGDYLSEEYPTALALARSIFRDLAVCHWGSMGRRPWGAELGLKNMPWSPTHKSYTRKPWKRLGCRGSNLAARAGPAEIGPSKQPLADLRRRLARDI